MKKLIALIGPSASGKNTILEELKRFLINYNIVVHYTTRPKRDREIEGIDYYFTNKEQLIDKITNDEILCANRFNDWTYAVSKDSVVDDRINIGIFNLDEIYELRYSNTIKLYIIYITASSKIRFIRSLERENEPDIAEIYRRYLSDDEEFDEFELDIESGAIKPKKMVVINNDKDPDYRKIIDFLTEVEKDNED